NHVVTGTRKHKRFQPPLTGGSKAISSCARRGVSQAANSWLREATSEARKRASSPFRLHRSANSVSIVAPFGSSQDCSASPATSLSWPKNNTFTRMVCAVGATDRLYRAPLAGTNPCYLDKRKARRHEGSPDRSVGTRRQRPAKGAAWQRTHRLPAGRS